jgi:hypothetical protein
MVAGAMDVPPDLIITMNDISRAGHCARGTKAFFRENELDFRDFLKNGIAASELAATGDARAFQVIERTLGEPGHG